MPRPREVARLWCLAARDKHDGEREVFVEYVSQTRAAQWSRSSDGATRLSKASAVALAMWMRAGDGVYLREIW